MSGMEVSTPSQSRRVTFSNGIVTNTRQAFISLLEPSDLQDVGGEDCSLARIVYELCFYGARRVTDTADATAMRMVFLLKEVQDTTAPQLLSTDYATSDGLGRDDILHTRDFVAPGQAGYENGGGTDLNMPFLSSNWIRGEVKASRRFTKDRRLVIGWSTVSDAGQVPQDFQFIGHVRTLIRHPK